LKVWKSHCQQLKNISPKFLYLFPFTAAKLEANMTRKKLYGWEVTMAPFTRLPSIFSAPFVSPPHLTPNTQQITVY